MKRFLFALLMSFTTMAPAASTYAEHGMTLFGGKDGLYASHLPMFHAPHDYQVVLQIRLADPARDRALRERLDGKTTLWTIAPEKFEIDRLAPGAGNPLKEFKADMVLGHFEQGGKVQMAGVTAIVDKVLLYRQLSPEMHQAKALRYLPVGRHFLVKEIDSRPDFDHIVLTRGKVDSPVSLARNGVMQPMQQAMAKASGAKVIGTIYFYTDDLR
jgi:hypothetical protein